MELGPLYHWSPGDRREAVLRGGLQPRSASHTASGSLAYICLSPSPQAAWTLSGDMDWMEDFDDWDLWQVRLVRGDEVRIRSDFGPIVVEVKVHNVVPPDRVWWVGRRTPWLTTPAKPEEAE